MTKLNFLRRTVLALGLGFAALPALAHDNPQHASAALKVTGAYAYASLPGAMSGAAYFVIVNGTDKDDHLLAVRSDVAQKTEIHTHLEEAGVMRMLHLADGLAIAAGATEQFRGGAHHVMFMGLTGPFVAGESFPLTLIFEQAGEQVVEVAIIERGAEAPAGECAGHAEAEDEVKDAAQQSGHHHSH